MAPLYATGSEFAWRESAWAQGGTAAFDAATYDVPAFVAAVRALYAAPGFAAADDAARLEALFGRAPDTPASRVGRYCGLNLRRLTSYGTLEFRRFHCTLDADLLLRWAHLCASFVEAFRGGARLAAVRAAPSVEAAVAALAAEQEEATADGLMRAMAGHVDARTAALFMRDSGALPRATVL